MAGTVSFFIKISDNGTFKKVEVDADSLRDAVKEVKLEADRLSGSIVNWSQASQSLSLLQQSFMELQGTVQGLSAAYAAQEVSERKLANNMRNTMNATEADVEAIKRLCAAEQELGVVGDEVQLAGAQELSTYLTKRQSLEQLIPVMNDMLAQQYGLEASQESAAQIASMLGKVMDGQVGALSRYGYQFDEVQEQILKFGSEEERAAVLAEVVESAVGGMNAELAKTESGRQQQLANRLGDVKEQLGGMVQGIAPLLTVGSQLVIIASGAARCVTTLKALSAAFQTASLRSSLLTVSLKLQSAAQRLLSAAGYTAAAGTRALTIATTALYATLTMGLSVVITALVGLFSRLGRRAEEASDGVDLLKDSTDAYRDTLSSTKADLDLEIVSLRRLIDSHGDAKKKVEELNQKYGEALGYHRSAAEWYSTLVEKSQAYCRQLGYEAQAKVVASQIAQKELERDALEEQQLWARRQYWDSKGRIHYNWEQLEGGEKAYESLGTRITALNGDLATLQRRYDTCIERMEGARGEVERQTSSAQVSGHTVAIESMTYEELGRAIDETKSSLSKLSEAEGAEASRLKEQLTLLTSRKEALGKQLGLEKESKGGGSSSSSSKDVLIDNAKSYAALSHNLEVYKRRLDSADASDSELCASLRAEISLLERARAEAESWSRGWGDLDNPSTLEGIDAAIRRQQQLRKQASGEGLSAIDREIERLQSLKREMEQAGHVGIPVEQIETYAQLEQELSYYEEALRHATVSERSSIQQQIDSLERLRREWDAGLSASLLPSDLSSLTTLEELDRALDVYRQKQQTASVEEQSSIGAVIALLSRKRQSLVDLSDVVGEQQALLKTLGDLSGKELLRALELEGTSGLESKIKSLKALLREPPAELGAESRSSIEQMVKEWERYDLLLKKSHVTVKDTWNDVKGLGSGVKSLSEALKGNGDAWDRVTGAIDGLLAVYEGIKGLVETVQLLTAATSAATQVTNANTAASATNTAVKSGEAVADATASGAKLPFPANLAAIAAGVAAVLAALAMVPKFADGAIAYGPTLGLFGEYAGASSNPEVVAPLSRLRNLLGLDGAGVGTDGGKVRFRIVGRDLVGVLEKELNLRKRG